MKVELWSNEISAANATDRTIRALPDSAYLKRGADGEVEFDGNGLAEVVNASSFTKFALERQGYVRRIVE